MKFYRDDPWLISVLTSASQADLAILIDFITADGEGRIALDKTVKNLLLAAKQESEINGDILLYIAEEIQKFGANTLVSVLRGGQGVLYKEIVCDVADRLKVTYNAALEVADIEGLIQLKILEKAMEKMSEDQKREFFDQFGVSYTTGMGAAAMAALLVAIKASGFYAYQLAAIIANGMARLLLSRGLAMGANAALTRTIGFLAGPIGWAVTAIWAAFDIAGPAYRVTMPCVIQVGYMRQKALHCECPNCGAQVVKTAKFCQECGHKLL
jgi:uncharacterized protein YaaW (UPF0174 family)